MELGFWAEGVEVQKPDDLARPLRDQEERVRRPAGNGRMQSSTAEGA